MKITLNIAKFIDSLIALALLLVGGYIFFLKGDFVSGALILAAHSIYQIPTLLHSKLTNHEKKMVQDPKCPLCKGKINTENGRCFCTPSISEEQLDKSIDYMKERPEIYPLNGTGQRLDQDTAGWEKRYWERFAGIATHPLANGLKDFIAAERQRAVETTRAEERVRAMEILSKIYLQSKKLETFDAIEDAQCLILEISREMLSYKYDALKASLNK